MRCLFLFATGLVAQTPAPAPRVIENTGKPIRIPFECTQEDMLEFGLACPAEHPCPVYLELDGLEFIGSSLFLTGNLHAESATIASILLASGDGGKTWQEPHERIRAAGLDLIQFIDAERGWIGGGTLGPVSRDPFLLVTHDGGKTWHSSPVFSESRAGTIDYFHFDSKDHGLMWIDRTQSGEPDDRYESYESMTGGESWTIRETSGQPLRKGPRPAAAPSEFRLRTDQRTHSYRIERHIGAAWEPQASFAVRAGECREPEFKLAPPPPAAPNP